MSEEQKNLSLVRFSWGKRVVTLEVTLFDPIIEYFIKKVSENSQKHKYECFGEIWKFSLPLIFAHQKIVYFSLPLIFAHPWAKIKGRRTLKGVR